MSTWIAKVTDKGNALLAKLTQGVTLEITTAKTGTGTVNVSELKAQTKVSSPKQTMQIQPVAYPETGKIGLPITVSNHGLTSSYTFWQIGVFAKDPDEGEILFFIAQAEDKGTDMLSSTMVASYQAEFVFYVEFDQADSVTVTVDPASSVTRAGMESYVSTEIQAAKNYVGEEVDGAKDYVDTQIQAATVSRAEKDLSNVEASHLKSKMDTAEIVTTAGTGAAYTATVPGITALKTGVSFTMIPHTASTTTQPTLNVNGLGAKSLRQPLTTNTGATTTAADTTWLASGKPVRVRYDGTLWEIDIPRPSATSLYGSVPIPNGGHGGTTLAEAQANLGIIALDEIPNLYVWRRYSEKPELKKILLTGTNYITWKDSCYVEYADAMSFKKGVISLVNPVTLDNPSEDDLAVVKGKYIYSSSTGKHYLVSATATIVTNLVTMTSGESFYAVSVNSMTEYAVSGTKEGLVASTVRDTYPTNGEHTDGYWYVYHKQLGE